MSADLIKKLEEATEGGRELDIALGQALGLIDADLIYTAPDGSRSGRGNRDPWPEWTNSVDRSLALAERVLPGSGDTWPWEISFYKGADTANWFAGLRPYGGAGFGSDGQSPALALCACILKAIHQKETGHD